MPFINVDQTTSAPNTPVVTLAADDLLIVGRDASIAALGTSSEGVLATSGGVIVFGDIYSLSDAAVRLTDGDVTVALSGFLVGANGVDFTVGLGLAVDGTVIGDVHGVHSAAGASQLSLTNTGQIQGGEAGVHTAGRADIYNTGLISSSVDAVVVNGAGLVTVVNAGVIQGQADALDLQSGLASSRREVRNTGLLVGDVRLSQGADRFNSAEGRVLGEVLLFGGADRGIGSIEDDLINGGAGADTLSGGPGGDTLLGGEGDDLFLADAGSGDFEDGEDEINGGRGVDIVQFRFSTTASLADPSRNGGQAAGDRFIGVENLRGSDFSDLLIGDARGNALSGGGGNDTLEGGDGADTLDGGDGRDTLQGGAGDDEYVVTFGDFVDESGGFDTVVATTDFTLGAGVEVLRAGSGIGLNLNGNELDNLITGGAGNDTLSGGGGNDTITGSVGVDLLLGGLGADSLTGGAGADIFRFPDPPSAPSADVLVDFTTGLDRISLEDFTVALPAGALSPTQFFVIGSGALQSEDRILFNPTTGELFSDRDGSGSVFAAVLFATLQVGGTVTAADFIVT